ncbi:pyruvate formate-lyase-activating protein [Lawsonibacter asaccharolyticus]|uniref:pyruvate formate-lyase-activating protein n=1 Tax=Eubacteriales TaxID=186802 RepID=UPI0023F1C16D|nr:MULTISPECIES: pyruvate formate-lyase-activating protein [Eubacteriales]UMM47107.1 pyruvate formate-lyase-activating protein [Lawsonibacter asaccharolyticus]
MTGYIHSMESMGLVDGPGVRAVVFLQGCPLRCRYCHNPDTQCGGGRPVEDGTLVRRLLRFRSYFDRSGGGVTFSGGEPLAQPDFLLACLRRLKAEGVHTCLDTSGAGRGIYGEILAHTDLVLYDVKHHEPAGYKAVTGGDMAATLDFVEAVRRAGTPMWVRHVVVPGLTDSRAHLEGLRAYVDTLPHVERVELLPFHKLGAHKYEALERTDPLAGTPPMDRDLCRRLEREFFAPYTTTAEKGRAV